MAVRRRRPTRCAALVGAAALALGALPGEAEAPGATGWSPLTVSAARLELGPVAVPSPSGCGDLCMRAQLLGCLHLSATGPRSSLFGGISGGALLHSPRAEDDRPAEGPPGRLLLVSDAGLLLTMKLRYEEVELAGGAKVPRPAAAGAAFARALPAAPAPAAATGTPARLGAATDMESVAVRWPTDVYVGVEGAYVIQRFAGASLLGRWAGAGARSGGAVSGLAGLEAALQSCRTKDDHDNQGPEAAAMVSGGAEIFVACEHSANGTTAAWIADAGTGEVRAAYTLELPEVDGHAGAAYRVAGASALPGAKDEVLVLFAFWSPEVGNRIKLGRLRPARREAADALAEPTRLRPAVVLELGEGAGVPMDNYEAVVVQPLEGRGAGYVVHLLSDDNFRRWAGGGKQRTLMLSVLLQSEKPHEVQGKFAPLDQGVAPAAQAGGHMGAMGRLGICCSLLLGATAVASLRQSAGSRGSPAKRVAQERPRLPSEAQALMATA